MLCIKLDDEALAVINGPRDPDGGFIVQNWTGRFPWPRSHPELGNYRIGALNGSVYEVEFETAAEDQVIAYVCARLLKLTKD